MITILKSGVSGMIGHQQKVDNISHNISNVNTTGFKGSRSNFSDLLYQGKVQRGTPVAPDPETGLLPQGGRGTYLTSTAMNLSTGIFKETGRSLDLAIEGEGFFGVELPDGSVNFTRSGSFNLVNLDEELRLVTSEGYIVEGDWESVPLDPLDKVYEYVHINSQGEIFLREARGHEETEEAAEGEDDVEEVPVEGIGETEEYEGVRLGQIYLYSFETPAGLSAQGGNLLAPTEASGDPVQGFPGEEGLGSIKQGVLESSNVNLIEEMSKLILSQKYFQFNSRSVHLGDEMWAMANQLKR